MDVGDTYKGCRARPGRAFRSQTKPDFEHKEIPVNDCTFSPARCHIDLGAIARNFSRLGPAEALMPVIKSDAYGHGLLPVARALAEAGARQFAVGIVDEGVALREAGLAQRVVTLLGAQSDADWEAARAHGIIPAVGDFEQLERAAAHSGTGAALRIAVQCETGMGRLGFTEEDLPRLLDRLRGMPGVEPALAVSHFACADMPEQEDYTAAQQRRFAAMTGALRAAFPSMQRSLANTAGLLGRRGTDCEAARPGLAIYGGNPFGAAGPDDAPALEWAMSVCAPVLSVRRLAAGQSVSYGRTFTAPRPLTVAVVGIGYATGFARALSNRAAMLVNGRRAPQVGRVCMGLTMLDVTDAGPVRPGDPAWALGGPAAAGERPVTPQELADLLGTIPYEVLCLMGGMNPRVYHS